MTVKDLKKRLEGIDEDKMVIITDGVGWCNVEDIEVKGCEVHIMQETEPLFND